MNTNSEDHDQYNFALQNDQSIQKNYSPIQKGHLANEMNQIEKEY